MPSQYVRHLVSISPYQKKSAVGPHFAPIDLGISAIYNQLSLASLMQSAIEQKLKSYLTQWLLQLQRLQFS